MVLCVSDAANAEGEKGAMKFRWQRKPLGMSIDCGGRGGRGGDEGLARTCGGDRAADEVVESSYAYPAELWYNA